MTDVPAIKLSLPATGTTGSETASALADAVQRGDAGALQTLLEGLGDESSAGAVLGTPDRRGLTPFHYAAIFGRGAALQTLLARCPAGVDARSSRGCTPLHHACRSRTASACVAPLLAAHADAAAADAAGWTPLHYAAYAGCRDAAAAILGSGSSSDSGSAAEGLLEARTGDGETPLATALARRHADVAALLVARGAAVVDAHGALLLRRLRCTAPVVARLVAPPADRAPLLARIAALLPSPSKDDADPAGAAAPCDARLCGASFAVPVHAAVVAARSRYCRAHCSRAPATIAMPAAATERATRLFVRWCYTGTLDLGEGDTDCALLQELLDLCWALNDDDDDDDDDEENEEEGEEEMKDGEKDKRAVDGECWTEAVVEAVVARVDGAVVAALWPRVAGENAPHRHSAARVRTHLLAHVLLRTPDAQQAALDALVAATPRALLARTIAALPAPQPAGTTKGKESSTSNSNTSNNTSDENSNSNNGSSTSTASAEQLRALVPRFMAPACPAEVRREIERTNALLGPAVLRQRLGERVLGRCRELHARTLKQSGAHWFRDPVDEVQSGAVGYYTVIAHPMDLATLRRKYLDSGGGGSATLLDFVNDGRVMWQNSFSFNAPTTDPFVCAQTLALYWEAHVCRFFAPAKERSTLPACSLRPHAAPDLPLTRREYETLAQKLALLDRDTQVRFVALADGGAPADSDSAAAPPDDGHRARDIDLALLPPAKMRELAAFVDREYAHTLDK